MLRNLHGKTSLRKYFNYMIIFGWGFQTIKNFGPVFKNLCSHCHNEDYWVLTRIMTWFTLFFIPIFPYEIKHHLTCPICKYGVTLSGEQVAQMKPIAEVNQLLVDGKITSDEYNTKISLLNEGTNEPKQVEYVETNSLLEVDAEHLSYCANCGTQTTKELKFCGNCGTAVNSK